MGTILLLSLSILKFTLSKFGQCKPHPAGSWVLWTRSIPLSPAFGARHSRFVSILPAPPRALFLFSGGWDSEARVWLCGGLIATRVLSLLGLQWTQTPPISGFLKYPENCLVVSRRGRTLSWLCGGSTTELGDLASLRKSTWRGHRACPVTRWFSIEGSVFFASRSLLWSSFYTQGSRGTEVLRSMPERRVGIWTPLRVHILDCPRLLPGPAHGVKRLGLSRVQKGVAEKF